MNLVSSQSYYSVVTSHRVTLGYPGGDKYSHTSVLVRFRTCQILYLSQFDRKKNVSTLGACSELITLARTCMSHDVALQETMFHCSVLSSFHARHKFRINEEDGGPTVLENVVSM